jgi:uncharacterized protein (TIGR02466 family)
MNALKNLLKGFDNMSEVIPLFPTPIYCSHIDDLDYEECRSGISMANFVNVREGMFLSSNEYFLDAMPRLKQKIIDNVNTFLFKKLNLIPFEYYFPDSWFVKVVPDGCGDRHIHANSLYSGVVYIDVHDNETGIRFYSGESNRVSDSVKYNIGIKEYNHFNSKSWEFLPRNGDIFIFPSYAAHEVVTNTSNRDRYSFAFNILPFNYKCTDIGSRIL